MQARLIAPLASALMSHMVGWQAVGAAPGRPLHRLESAQAAAAEIMGDHNGK
jgi:hypothetical protein